MKEKIRGPRLPYSGVQHLISEWFRRGDDSCVY
jgi:hypothetical protein